MKKSMGNSAMKPAIRKPAVISFQSIAQSPRKLWATSDQASSESSREPPPAEWCWWPLSAARACSRACCSSRRETNTRNPIHISTIKHQAAHELGQRELPAEEDPHHDPDLEDEVRRGELEHHRRDEARAFLEDRLRDRHRRVAAGRRGRPEPTSRGRPSSGRRPPRDCSIRERGTQAWTTAESRNPSTSAHQTSHAIWNAFQSPCPIWSRTSISPTITSG